MSIGRRRRRGLREENESGSGETRDGGTKDREFRARQRDSERAKRENGCGLGVGDR